MYKVIHRYYIYIFIYTRFCIHIIYPPEVAIMARLTPLAQLTWYVERPLHLPPPAGGLFWGLGLGGSCTRRTHVGE